MVQGQSFQQGLLQILGETHGELFRNTNLSIIISFLFIIYFISFQAHGMIRDFSTDSKIYSKPPFNLLVIFYPNNLASFIIEQAYVQIFLNKNTKRQLIIVFCLLFTFPQRICTFFWFLNQVLNRFSNYFFRNISEKSQFYFFIKTISFSRISLESFFQVSKLLQQNKNKYQKDMRKEETRDGATPKASKPFNITFTPLILYASFQTKMKLQIALHRPNKFCKTPPMKFLPEQVNVDGGVLIQNQELAFFTTLQEIQQAKLFESKIINVQVACQIDGRKYDLENKINMKDEVTPIKNTSKICLKLSQDPQIELVCRIKINEGSSGKSKGKIDEGEGASVKTYSSYPQVLPMQRSIPKERKDITKQKKDITKQKKEDRSVTSKNERNKSKQYQRMINKMKEQYEQRQINFKKNLIQKMKQEEERRSQSMKKKITQIKQQEKKFNQMKKKFSQKLKEDEQHRENQINKKIIEKLKEQYENKEKQMKKMLIAKMKQEEQHREKQMRRKLIAKMKQEEQHRENQMKKKFLSKMKEGESEKQIQMKSKFKKIIEDFEKKLKEYQEKEISYQEQLKKLFHQNQSLSNQKKQLEKNITVLERKNEENHRAYKDLQKANQDIKNNMSNKFIAASQNQKSLEEQIRNKTQKIHSLEKQLNHLKESSYEVDKRIHIAETNEQQMKKKYQESEKKNLLLTEEITSISYQKEKYKKQITVLQQKLKQQENEYEEEISNIHSKSQNLKRDGGDIEKLKTRVITLEKELESKKQLLKVIGTRKQSKQTEIQSEYDQLKAQNEKLKKQVDQLREKQTQDTALLVLKLAHEKLRRECDQVKKNEKALLIDKSSVETKLKTMQQEIIKSKQVIATVINLIQEHGDENLYTLVTDCIA